MANNRPLIYVPLIEGAKALDDSKVDPSRLRAHGYIPDAPDCDPTGSCLMSAKAFMGASSGRLPDEVDWSGLSVHVWNQFGTNSCVGWAEADAIFDACKLGGHPIAMPSPLFPYLVARALARGSAKEPLTDTGCSPTLAMRGLMEWGVPSMEQFPFFAGALNTEPTVDVNAEPDLLALEEASEFKVLASARIDSDGDYRCNDIRQALADGHFPTGGTQLAPDFDNYGPDSAPITAPTHSRGGHMIRFVGYKNRLFKIKNSWGYEWGQGGFAWVDESFVQRMSDVRFVVGVPLGARRVAR